MLITNILTDIILTDTDIQYLQKSWYIGYPICHPYCGFLYQLAPWSWDARQLKVKEIQVKKFMCDFVKIRLETDKKFGFKDKKVCLIMVWFKMFITKMPSSVLILLSKFWRYTFWDSGKKNQIKSISALIRA